MTTKPTATKTIRVPIDTLEYTRKGLRTREPLSFDVGNEADSPRPSPHIHVDVDASILRGAAPQAVIDEIREAPDFVVGRWMQADPFLKWMPFIMSSVLMLGPVCIDLLEDVPPTFALPRGGILWLYVGLAVVMVGMFILSLSSKPFRICRRTMSLHYMGETYSLRGLSGPRRVLIVRERVVITHDTPEGPMRFYAIEVRRQHGDPLVLYAYIISKRLFNRLDAITDEINDAIYDQQRYDVAQAMLRRHDPAASSPYRQDRP